MGWGAIDATRCLTDYVALIARWKERADLVTKYEDMMADPVSEAAKIGEIIGLELWPDTVLEAVEDVRALRQPERDPSGPAIQYDRETLLHSGHVAGHREPL